MTNSMLTLIRNNIKKFRAQKKLTQEQLSEISGISCEYLSTIERGKRTPSLKRFLLIAQALDVSPQRFFE